MNSLSIDKAPPSPSPNRRAALVLRQTGPADAAQISRFVEHDDTLETNSPYAYLLLCDHFRDTCWLAMDGDTVAGFVAAYRPPTRPKTVFVWQVGVGTQWRGHGIGGRLLRRLALECGPGICFLEATVTPGNVASEQLFRSFARAMGAAVEIGEGYPASLFPDRRNEPERLFRIGPFGGEK